MESIASADESIISPFYRNKKGKFVSKSKKRWLDDLKESCSKRKRSRNSYMSTSRGSRIIELDTLAEELFCPKCNTGLFLRDTDSEMHHCLASTLIVAYRLCNNHYKVNTCKSCNSKSGKKKYSLNGKVVVGMYDIGIGPRKLNDFLSCVDIPTINPSVLKKYEDEIANVIDECANDSFKESHRNRKVGNNVANNKKENVTVNVQIQSNGNTTVLK